MLKKRMPRKAAWALAGRGQRRLAGSPVKLQGLKNRRVQAGTGATPGPARGSPSDDNHGRGRMLDDLGGSPTSRSTATSPTFVASAYTVAFHGAFAFAGLEYPVDQTTHDRDHDQTFHLDSSSFHFIAAA